MLEGRPHFAWWGGSARCGQDADRATRAGAATAKGRPRNPSFSCICLSDSQAYPKREPRGEGVLGATSIEPARCNGPAFRGHVPYLATLFRYIATHSRHDDSDAL
jgi:hypothetical protein